MQRTMVSAVLYLTSGSVDGSTQGHGQDVDLEERQQRQSEEPGRRAGHGRDVQARHVEVDEHRAALPAPGAAPRAHAAAALRVVREVRVPGDAEPASLPRPELDAKRVGAEPRLRRRDGGGGLLLASAGACYGHGPVPDRRRPLESRKRGGTSAWVSRIRELSQGWEVRRGGFDAAGCHWACAHRGCVAAGAVKSS